jgi:uncharacterized protein (TIGR00661 family)
MMKILYGVQGTGNGHISRSLSMARAFEDYSDLDVTWLYSGCPRDELLGVGDHYLWRRGMTFASEAGKINLLKTVTTNNLAQFLREVHDLDLSSFDLVISDYEPVIAWAAKSQGIPTLGIGHQYAFMHDVPIKGGNPISKLLLHKFAPVSRGLGLHWHHFNQPVLPPIADLDGHACHSIVPKKIVVYLPFEDQQAIIQLLKRIPEANFYLYGPGLSHDDKLGHVHTRPISRSRFKHDLTTAEGVMCNAGFELPSECLLMGTRILTKPLIGQIEQISNAEALEVLNYGRVLNRWTIGGIKEWLSDQDNVRVTYPAVHTRLAQWIAAGQPESIAELAEQLWSEVKVERNVHRQQIRVNKWSGLIDQCL